MWNPFGKAKKAIDTKLKKAAVAAAIAGVLTAAAYRFDVPLAKDTIDNLASALSSAVVEVMDAPVNPPKEDTSNDQ